jgi:serine/threonine-protein kinase
LLEGKHKGFFLDQYKLFGEALVGGPAATEILCLAEHVPTQCRVAIKVVRKGCDTACLARFYRIARASASLKHPNVVRVYEANDDGDIHYMVMEFVDGRDFFHVAGRGRPLDYAKAADYILQAAEGLGYLHSRGIVHRNINPFGFLVDQNNIVKIHDLASARFPGDHLGSITEQVGSDFFGLAGYVAPERAREDYVVDARSDIYSLGCVFYYLLTGHSLFPGGTLPQKLMAHQKQEPPSITRERPDAPADLIAICMKMLAKNPADRYQSMDDVAEALRRWLLDHGHGA